MPNWREDRDGDLDREVGVDPDPAQGHQEHQRARQVCPTATERGPPEHHLIDAGLVTHHGEGREDRAADDVARHDDGDGLPQPEVQHDAQRAECPVDRRDVGPGPDPHLLWSGGVFVGFRNGQDAVSVDLELGSGVGRHVIPPGLLKVSSARCGWRDTAPPPETLSRRGAGSKLSYPVKGEPVGAAVVSPKLLIRLQCCFRYRICHRGLLWVMAAPSPSNARRPSIVAQYAAQVAQWLREEPTISAVEIMRRAQALGYNGGRARSMSWSGG